MTIADASVWLAVQGAQNREHFDRGIPRYVRDHALALVAAAPAAIGAVGLDAGLPLTANLDRLVGSGLLRWNDRRPERLPAVFHIMSPFELHLPLERVWPAWARDPRVRTAATLFDLIPLVFRDHYLADDAMRARYEARAQLIRAVDRVFAISQTTAEDAVRLLGVPEERITVIDAGVSSQFRDTFDTAADAERVVARSFPDIRHGFMLYVAGVEFRKNLERLIGGFGMTSEAFRDRHQLVITCRIREIDEQRLRNLARDAGLRDRDLIFTNHVTDTELAALYRTCQLFVFASFYEGSGLPILEAMACGAPVAASSTSTSPEILGDLAATFDPFDPSDIARVLEATASDEALLDRLRDRSRARAGRYTWERVAAETLAGYERMRVIGRARPARRRIALHTPWPPERSGIAQYNLRLARELGQHVDVDVVVSGDESDYAPPLERGLRIVAADRLHAHGPLRAPDRHVYCMGNSHFHHKIHDALVREPGVVVCHDVRLAGFYSTYVATENPADPVGAFAHRLRVQYGDRLGRGFLDAMPTPWEQAELGIYMTEQVQRCAERLIVHSRYAADLLRLDVPGDWARRTPIEVVPLALPEPGPAHPRPVPPGGGLVVSFGIVSAVKMPETLVDAIARLRASRPDVRLVFAGGAEPWELAQLREHAAAAGVADAVEVLGHVSDAEYARLLRDAHVAVQLRRVQNGEASAAVGDALAAGVPTVVTGEGWAGELPEEVVAKVPRDLTGPVLASVIDGVLGDEAVAAAMSEAARAFAADASFTAVAERYLEVLGLD